MDGDECFSSESALQTKESLHDVSTGISTTEEGDLGIEFVSFCGGGITGISLIGALQEFKERGIYRSERHPKFWLGSSAGSIAATFAAIGVSTEYLERVFFSVELKSFLDYGGRSSSSSLWDKIQNYRYGFSELITKFGAVRGERFRRWLEERFVELGWSKDTTFKELYDRTGRHLIITATSLNTYETLYLSRSSFPNMKIVDAVDASIRIPYLFQPKLLSDSKLDGDRVLIDGGVLDNLPINACDVVSERGEILAFNRKAIGFTLMHKGRWTPEYTEINSLIQHTMAFIHTMTKKIQTEQSLQPYFWNRIVPIDTGGVLSTEFDIGKEKLLGLIEEGRRATKEFLDRREKEIRERGPLPDNLFIPNFRLQNAGVKCLSNDLLEKTSIYKTE